jgi:DNA-binding transcriptional ArsR family regulator
MARSSSITRLPNEIRDAIAALRENGRTIDEILEHLNTMGADVSRSSLGRHLKKADQVAAQIMKSRALADAVTSKFGDASTSKVARVNLELMHGILLQVLTGAEDGQEVTLDPKDAMFLATAFEKLAKAQKSDVEVQIKVAVENERQAAKEKAADVVAKEGRRAGLSSDTIDSIKKLILGVE